jgi:hypothetical protein
MGQRRHPARNPRIDIMTTQSGIKTPEESEYRVIAFGVNTLATFNTETGNIDTWVKKDVETSAVRYPPTVSAYKVVVSVQDLHTGYYVVEPVQTIIEIGDRELAIAGKGVFRAKFDSAFEAVRRMCIIKWPALGGEIPALRVWDRDALNAMKR